MLDWKVFDEEPLPEEPEEAPPPARPPWLLRTLALLLLLLLALGAWGLKRFMGQQDTRLREDLSVVVTQEERALRVAAVEQAEALSDPNASLEWYRAYEATFLRDATLPLPEVEQVEFSADTALVTLGYTLDEGRWQSVRAYRLMQGEWRRTPIPADAWGEPELYRSAHFSLWMSDRDAALLPPDELLRFLEQFHIQFAHLWPVESGDRALTLRLEPRDLAPVVVPDPLEQPQTLLLTSPLIANDADFPDGPPARRYYYQVASAVAERLDTLAGTEDYRNPDETGLRARLREALVRFLLLTVAEQERYREELLPPLGTEPETQVAEDLDPATMVFLADYLIASEGPEALAQLSVARLRSVDLPAAMIHAFGFPLEQVLVEVRLWMERSRLIHVPPEEEVPSKATLLRVLKEEPFEAMMLLEEGGQLVRYRSNEPVSLEVPLLCLGMGSQLSFRRLSEPGPEVLGDTLRLEAHRLPSQVAPILPPGASIVVAHRENNRTELVALDAQGQSWPLLMLADVMEIITDPYSARFAYFEQDRCGLSINQYVPGEPTITRTPVPLQKPGSLFFAQEGLYLMEKLSLDEPLTLKFSRIHAWATGQMTETVIPNASEVGKVLGYDRKGNRYLILSEEWGLLWLEPARGESYRVGLVPALPPEAEPKVLSPDGRYLAYTLAAEDGSTQLYARNLQAQDEPALLFSSSSATTFGEVVWSPDGAPRLATRSGIQLEDRLAGNTLLWTTIPADGNTAQGFGTFYLDGQIDQLHWCADGALYYRLTRDSNSDTVIATGLSERPREIARNAEIVGCLGAP